MPVLTQLKLNIGTEQNPNMVLHDLHDIRISSTDVTTVTRLLGCDAGVNSIAPLTLANAASLLGVGSSINEAINIDNFNGFYATAANMGNVWTSATALPGTNTNTAATLLQFTYNSSGWRMQRLLHYDDGKEFIRAQTGAGWIQWKKL